MIGLMWAPGMTLESIEKEVILQAFRFYKSNKTQTSSALGIAIRTLDNKLEKYQMDSKSQQEAEDARKRKHEDFIRRSRGLAPIHSGNNEQVIQNGVKAEQRRSVGSTKKIS